MWCWLVFSLEKSSDERWWCTQRATSSDPKIKMHDDDSKVSALDVWERKKSNRRNKSTKKGLLAEYKYITYGNNITNNKHRTERRRNGSVATAASPSAFASWTETRALAVHSASKKGNLFYWEKGLLGEAGQVGVEKGIKMYILIISPVRIRRLFSSLWVQHSFAAKAG